MPGLKYAWKYDLKNVNQRKIQASFKQIVILGENNHHLCFMMGAGFSKKKIHPYFAKSGCL